MRIRKYLEQRSDFFKHVQESRKMQCHGPSVTSRSQKHKNATGDTCARTKRGDGLQSQRPGEVSPHVPSQKLAALTSI